MMRTTDPNTITGSRAYGRIIRTGDGYGGVVLRILTVRIQIYHSCGS